MIVTFTIIIPTYNAEKTIGILLGKLIKIIKHNVEIIIIDSESTDRTLKIIKSFNYPITIVTIKQSEFNHGETRNLGVSMAKGEFICFFSQDVIPVTDKLFNYLEEDFKRDIKIKAVFGKQLASNNSFIIEKIDADCLFLSYDTFTNTEGIFIQRKVDIESGRYTKFIGYSLFNSFTAYRKEYLLKNPFPRVQFGEDFVIGKKIITSNVYKLYDQKCVVEHHHDINLTTWIQRQYKFSKVIKKNSIVLKLNIWSKVIYIFHMQTSWFTKLKYLFLLVLTYIIKFSIRIVLVMK